MKRPKINKRSKRITCRKKYKIEKKVREHNRKKRKESKKSDHSKKRKDPGVPNAAPFKEAVLKEAQDRKQKMEEEKQRQKERRRSEVDKRRNLSTLQEDALKRQNEFDAKNEMLENMIPTNDIKSTKADNSCKAYYKEFRKVVEAADVILQVLDARDPLGCRCTEVEKTILASGTNKRIVFVLNKIDLVPKENVESWLKYLRNEFPTIAFKSSTQSQKVNLSQNRTPIHILNKEVLTTSSQCLGASNLLKLLGNYCRNNGIRTSISVGVIGFPNVGKSSLINSLKRARACNVGATPGVTKQIQEVIIDKHVKIIDCPGIVMATGSNAGNLALRNCVKVESLDDPITPVDAILKRCNKEQMMMHYNIGNYHGTSHFLTLLSKRQGRLLKGGLADVDKTARCVLQDWNSGQITYYTHPPKKALEKSQVEAQIVTEMAKEFDWDSLESDNQTTLDEVRGAPSASFGVLYKSMGPVSDVAMEGDGRDGEEEEMEDSDDEEEGKFTVEVKEKPTTQIKENIRPVNLPAPVEPISTVEKSGSNIQANKNLKAAAKRNKKKKKKANALAEKLGDSLLTAMDFSTRENYDFDKDFVMGE